MGVGEPRKLLSLAMRQQFGGRCCGSPSGCYDGMMLLASNCDRGVKPVFKGTTAVIVRRK
ncbi:hypothetical protein [Bartonella sp. ML69XJBT]|uniref:hypothetical protein n=1 Tax=Bartonella sp. ML69XJBT TaxID=3019092 RepID=UPI002362FBF5|nr:hypothetical protein [Bartonella sp. ML69XJBT]